MLLCILQRCISHCSRCPVHANAASIGLCTCHVCISCTPVRLQGQPQVSARQAVIFCPTCGARHGLWTFLGGQATAVKPRWPVGSPLPPLLGGASPRGTRGAAQRGGQDPATHSAPPKSRAAGGGGVADVGEGNEQYSHA